MYDYLVISLFLSCVCVRSSREWGEWGDWHSVRVGGHEMPPHEGLLGGALAGHGVGRRGEMPPQSSIIITGTLHHSDGVLNLDRLIVGPEVWGGDLPDAPPRPLERDWGFGRVAGLAGLGASL